MKKKIFKCLIYLLIAITSGAVYLLFQEIVYAHKVEQMRIHQANYVEYLEDLAKLYNVENELRDYLSTFAERCVKFGEVETKKYPLFVIVCENQKIANKQNEKANKSWQKVFQSYEQKRKIFIDSGGSIRIENLSEKELNITRLAYNKILEVPVGKVQLDSHFGRKIQKTILFKPRLSTMRAYYKNLIQNIWDHQKKVMLPLVSESEKDTVRYIIKHEFYRLIAKELNMVYFCDYIPFSRRIIYDPEKLIFPEKYRNLFEKAKKLKIQMYFGGFRSEHVHKFHNENHEIYVKFDHTQNYQKNMLNALQEIVNKLSK